MPSERCAACGTARRGDLQVCVQCETPFPAAAEPGDAATVPAGPPAAVAKPSPVQSHGTLMLFMLGGFVLLGVLLSLSVRGVGPFTARIVQTTPRDAGEVGVTVEVRNDGTKAGRGRCTLGRVDTVTGDRRPDFEFLSDRVPGGSTVTQLVVVRLDPGVTTTGTISC